MDDTIYALSSGQGPSGVAVVRISGALAGDALLAVSGAPLPPPRQAAVRSLRDPRSGELLDRGLALWFPGSASFTGEPSAELHLHGGRAVTAGVLTALAGIPGLRPAQPGEFTRRAFENGKLDLAQAEAVGDLIAADTSAQRRLALRGLEGDLGARVLRWRDQLLGIKALIAAEIDFSDEGDVGEGAASGIDSTLERLIAEMSGVLRTFVCGRVIAEGLRVALVGKPNSGKSTLLNALSGSEAAIVTEHAGTTRDVIEVRLDWDGYPIVLWDTAGLRETSDEIEKLGIRRTRERLQQADAILHLDEAGAWEPLEVDGSVELIRVRTKSDIEAQAFQDPAAIEVSALTGAGLGELRKRVLAVIDALGAGEPAIVVRDRQRVALESAVAAAERAMRVPQHAVELRDHEIRSVEAALERLVGRSGVEETLGAVFSRFCVGK